MAEGKSIYLSPPHMGGTEMRYINEAFETNWVSPAGPHIEAFEREFSEITGAPHAAALSSGTAAIHLALVILGVGREDEVICQSFTFCGSANPIAYQGATPVFVDSEESSWNMDPGLFEDAVKDRINKGRKPKAAVLVHIFGQSAEIAPILETCRRYEIPLIEDAAESLGALYLGRHTGTYGDLGAFSFNGNKIITTGGGGMLVSGNGEYIKKAKFLSTQARDAAPHYEHTSIGYNYRLSNVLAGIGRGQLRVLNDRVEARRRNFDFYRRRLSGLPGIAFQPEIEGSAGNRWLTCITVDPTEFGGTREDIRLALASENIESRPLWKPMHLQPVFKGCLYYGGGVSERLFESGLCLPSGSSLAEEDLCRVADAIIKTARRS